MNTHHTKIEELNLYVEEFQKNEGIKPPTNIDELKANTKKLFKAAENGKVSALGITEFMKNKLSQKESNAKQWEHFIAHLNFGQISDDMNRKTETNCVLERNSLKKGDVTFPSGYEISVKTLFETTKELNLGAFSAKALFEGFLPLGREEDQLGSKRKILQTLKTIEDNGQYVAWGDRFETNVRKVYTGDMELTIKKKKAVDKHFIKAKDLCDMLVEAVRGGPESAISVINRFNKNDFRIDRQSVMDPSVSTMITLEFSDTNGEELTEFTKEISELAAKLALGTITLNELKQFQKLTSQYLTN